MSDITFLAVSQGIAAGTVTADTIKSYSCGTLTGDEKRALLAALASKQVADSTSAELSSVYSGNSVGAAELEIPSFKSGSITVVDTDGSATATFDGTHQSVDDSNGDSYPEGTSMQWDYIPGSYYAGRTLTVPAGVILFYTFVLQ